MILVDVMRAGPSTGIASKTEQSDINLAVYGAHGDAPRIVLAPMSVADCINTTEYAVYVAEALQSPVIVLSDQSLGQATTVIDPVEARPTPLKQRTDGVSPAKPFKRYAIGPDPVTPMPLPGTPGYEWVAEGLTHNEAGLPASGAGAHVAQIRKRVRKIASFDAGKYWGGKLGRGRCRSARHWLHDPRRPALPSSDRAKSDAAERGKRGAVSGATFLADTVMLCRTGLLEKFIHVHPRRGSKSLWCDHAASRLPDFALDQRISMVDGDQRARRSRRLETSRGSSNARQRVAPSRSRPISCMKP